MRYRANTKDCAKRGGRGALFASSVSLTSPLRCEVPGKTKVATSISRSIPFRPVPSKPHVSGRNADASKSGRILHFQPSLRRRENWPPHPPRRSASSTQKIKKGASDVPRRMCPNVTCHSLPVCRASDSYSHHSKHSSHRRPHIANHIENIIAILRRLRIECPFVPTPPAISQSEFGSTANVGYDGMKKSTIPLSNSTNHSNL